MRVFVVVCILVSLSGVAHAETFHGFACTRDCSGHKAGYGWAQSKGIEARAGCTGNSRSFREGCLAYVEELEQSAEGEEASHAASESVAAPEERDAAARQ